MTTSDGNEHESESDGETDEITERERELRGLRKRKLDELVELMGLDTEEEREREIKRRSRELRELIVRDFAGDFEQCSRELRDLDELTGELGPSGPSSREI
jgi:hypothetical protein